MLAALTGELELLALTARQRLSVADGGLSDAWKMTAELGWPGIGIAENAGGSGGTFGDLLVVLFEHGFRSIPLPLAEQAIACQLLADAEPFGQHLGACLDGSIKVTVAPSVQTLEGGRLVLPAVPWAASADVVIAVHPDEGGTVMACELSEAGIRPATNLAGEDRSDVEFTSMQSIVPLGSVEPERLRILGGTARSAQIAGAARRSLGLSTHHANERRQFGRAIADFQAVAHMLAKMSELCTGSESVVGAIVELGEPDVDLAASAKLWTWKAATMVSRLAHQVHGAIGTTYEHPLGNSTLRLRAWRGEFGGRRSWAGTLGGRVVSDEASWWAAASPFDSRESR